MPQIFYKFWSDTYVIDLDDEDPSLILGITLHHDGHEFDVPWNMLEAGQQQAIIRLMNEPRTNEDEDED